MFVFIPGELIALLTFPGVILHEISHRFFCDIYNIPVYAISYFSPLSKKAGHVIHGRTDNIYHKFLIAIGPLIINSIICMLLTFPFACSVYLHTTFVDYVCPSLSLPFAIMAWIGYSSGFNAIPSNQDMNGLVEKASSAFGKLILIAFTLIVALFNLPIIGFFLSLGFAVLISWLLPYLILG